MSSSVDDTAIDDGLGETAPVWAVFGDLMSGVVGAFVLILIGVLLVQMDLVSSLQSEIAKRQQEEARRMALEKGQGCPDHQTQGQNQRQKMRKELDQFHYRERYFLSLGLQAVRATTFWHLQNDSCL